MGVDPYSRCPGGLGKKVKFCCPDLVQELGKLERMVDSDQMQGSLDYLERLEQKFPNRPCLQTYKAMVLDMLGRSPMAKATLEQLVAAQPDNAAATARLALLTAREQDPRQGVELMQKAIAASGKTVQGTVVAFFGDLGRILISQGCVVSAIQHFLMYQVAAQDSNNEYLRDLNLLFSSPSVPYPLKELPLLRLAPENVPWKESADAAVRMARTLRWQKAAETLDSLSMEASESPEIWWNLAIVRGWLADHAGAAEAWRRFAALPVPQNAAVEAELVALVLSEELEEEKVDQLRIVFEFEDFDRALEQLQACRRFDPIGVDWQLLRSEEGKPPPRAGFFVLDRELPPAGSPESIENIAIKLAAVLLFGRETDRSPRAEILCPRTEDLAVVLKICQDRLEPVGGQQVSEEVVGALWAFEALLDDKTMLPRGADSKTWDIQRRAFLEQQIRSHWLTWPWNYFGGRSLAEVAKSSQERIRLEAFLRYFEHVAANRVTWIDFDSVRALLHLPPRERVRAAGDDVNHLTLGRLLDLDVAPLGEDDLTRAYQRSTQAGLERLTARVAAEVLKRPDWKGKPSRAEACEILSRGEPTLLSAQARLKEAQKAAEEDGESSAVWDLLEFQLLARHGQPGAKQVLEHVLDVHGSEPGVRSALLQVMQHLGLVRPDGTLRAFPPRGPADSQDDLQKKGVSDVPRATGIWTPDRESQPREKVSIWTPGD